MENMKLVIAQLQKSFGYADSLLDKMWQIMMHRTAGNVDDLEFQERESEVEGELADCLRSLGIKLSVALEMMELAETRRDFLSRWSGFNEQALGQVMELHGDWGDSVQSIPLDLCKNIMHIIEAPYESEITSAENAEIEILKFVLESTPKIVERNVLPQSETDLQRIMHAHLAATFQSFTKRITIAKPIMSFHPDCGIVDLKAAIEIKYVNNEEELKVALHGLNEDLSAYAGSLDWTRFYTLIYQTGSYGVEKSVVNALRKSGNADRWWIKLVTGLGTRRNRP